jgi:hypothetical protein
LFQDLPFLFGAQHNTPCLPSQTSHIIIIMSSSSSPIVPCEEWFQQGRRVLYDPACKRIVKKETPTSVYIWERVVAPMEPSSQTRWLTLLPTPPDGSYGFSKVDGLLQTAPRLYIEYVGQGDSDKPSNYDHSVMDRANMVEAQWKAHKIRRTVLVCMGCSSLTMMELLNRQTERLSLGLPLRTRIEHVLCINGGYFANAHTPHPLNTSPLIKNTVGRVALKAAQHYNIVLDPIIKSCYGKDYDLSKEELRESAKVIRRHNGTNYLTGSASRYIEEHKKYTQRWDLFNVYYITRRQGVSFTIVGTEQDRFESKSFHQAQEKLSVYPDVYFESLPGGFKLASEDPHRVAELIDAVATSPAYDGRLSSEYHNKRSSMSSASTISTASSSSPAWDDSDFAHSEYELFDFSGF